MREFTDVKSVHGKKNDWKFYSRAIMRVGLGGEKEREINVLYQNHRSLRC